MNDLEILMAEFDNDLTFIFRSDMPDRLPGLLVDKTIYINTKIPFDKAIAVLAEKLAIIKQLPQKDISNYSDIKSMKYELKGREWGFKKLVPQQKLLDFISKRDEVMSYEIAEEFGVPDSYVQEAIEMYKTKGVI